MAKDKNQKKSNRGGKRPGSGRPKGTKDLPKIKDFMTNAQVQEITNRYFEQAKEDNRVLTHLIDHIYGKAKQAIVGGDEDDSPLIVKIVKYGGNNTPAPVQTKGVPNTDISSD